MVTNDIILGYIISSKGIGVEKSKIKFIANLPTPKSIKDVRSFLGHACFYRSFIKDFSVISKWHDQKIDVFSQVQECRSNK